jgi:hypothetical protein
MILQRSVVCSANVRYVLCFGVLKVRILFWSSEFILEMAPYISPKCQLTHYVRLDCVWNVMAHAHKPDFVYRRNGRVHLNRRGRQFSRLLAAEVCASAIVMLNTPCSEVVWRVLATHSIRQFPLHFPSRASSCAITFQLGSTNVLKRVELRLRTDERSGRPSK